MLTDQTIILKTRSMLSDHENMKPFRYKGETVPGFLAESLIKFFGEDINNPDVQVRFRRIVLTTMAIWGG